MDEKGVKRTVLLEHLVHDAKRCIALNFPYDAELIAFHDKIADRHDIGIRNGAQHLPFLNESCHYVRL